MPPFSKKEAIRTGWSVFKANWVFLVIVTLVSMVIGYLPTVVSSVWSQQYPIQTAIFSIIFWVVSLVVSVGLLKISLGLVDGASVNFDDLYSHCKLVWKFLVVQALVGLIVVVGVILLVIPGIIFGIKLQFAPYFVIDKGMGPIAAIKASWIITGGSVVNLFFFGILIGLIYLLGLLVFGVGLLVAIPVTGLALAGVYRKLAATP